MDTDELRAALEIAVADLDGVTWKRMFGCDAAFRDGTIFGLIWKENRIGLKFPTTDAFDARISVNDSERWMPGGRTTKHWVLIPEHVANSPENLHEWATQAHSLVE